MKADPPRSPVSHAHAHGDGKLYLRPGDWIWRQATVQTPEDDDTELP